MLKHGMRIFLRVYPIIFLIGCAKLNFQSKENSELPQTSASTTTSDQKSMTERFSVNNTTTKTFEPLDMIWVIDNSRSMEDNVDQVRANLKSFLTSLSTSIDIRFVLLNYVSDYGTFLSLPAGLPDSQFKTINQEVTSVNGPEMVLQQIPIFKNKYPDFFRVDAKKVIVFVTDDNSSLDSSSFLIGLQNIGWDLKNLSVFSFIGLGEVLSPCQDNTGSVYQSLAKSTNGVVYNICDLDWSSHFSDIDNNIKFLTTMNYEFKLSSLNIISILSVSVDGVLLHMNQFSLLHSNTLILNKDVRLADQSQIIVNYTIP